MRDTEQTRIFAYNLNHYVNISKKSQKEISDAIGVLPQTFNTWCQGIAFPRMGKIQLLADYFGISKTDLIEAHDYQRQGIHSKTIFLLGRVAAGSPIFAEENIIGELDVPLEWSNNQEYFGLLIKGNSMEPQIRNHDIVIVHRQDTAEPGNIVIATINGDDAVCKKFMVYGNTILLRSFNSEYDDIDVTGSGTFHIWGKVIEARHRF